MTVRVNGQQTYRSTKGSATLKPVALNAPGKIEVRISGITEPPPGFYVRCGDLFLEPEKSISSQDWTFVGTTLAPTCVLGVAGIGEAEFPSGIQTLVVQVGQSQGEIYTHPGGETQPPITILLTAKNGEVQKRAIYSHVHVSLSRDSTLILTGVFPSRPKITPVGDAHGQWYISPGDIPDEYVLKYQQAFATPLEEIWLLYSSHLLLVIHLHPQ